MCTKTRARPAPVQRPEFLAERFLEACRVLELPQEFEDYQVAEAFRILRGGPNEVDLHLRDGTYHAVPHGEPCGCGSEAPA